MKAEDLFKFVAIRTPRATATDSPMSAGSAADTFVARIRAQMTGDVSLPQARTLVANSTMDSDGYVMRDPRWKPFLAVEPQARQLLRDDAVGLPLRPAVDALISTATGVPTVVSEFVESSAFDQMHGTLWHSYYSNLALVDRRAGDRPRLLFWLRFWRFLESLTVGEPEAGSLAGFDRWMPVVPHELMQAEPTKADPDQPPPARVTPRGAKVAASRRAVRDLRAARGKVSTVLAAKLAATNVEPSARGRAPVPGNTALSAPTPPPANVSSAAVVTTFEAMENFGFDDEFVSWRLAAEDLDSAVLATLEHHHISVTAHDAAEIIAMLDKALAEERSALQSLEQVEHVAIVRGVPVRRKRRLSEAELGLGGSDEA
ncbi:hypothetical protein [Micromonospora sp. NPDC126480]|uniref:hypothetical protein n=1 Tax=Micromonospora sp. NPDC126480 TaxID=3155312 RepID=UPI003331E44F